MITFTFPPFYPWETNLRNPLVRRLCGPLNRYEPFRVDENLVFAGNRTLALQPVQPHAIPTELCWLFKMNSNTNIYYTNIYLVSVFPISRRIPQRTLSTENNFT